MYKTLLSIIFVFMCNISFGLSIDSEPSSQTQLDENTTLTLSVSASSTYTLTYQWKYQGTSIYGRTSNTLVVPHFYMGNEGFYSCLVSDMTTQTETNGTTVTLTDAIPVIISQSLNQRISLGDSASFSVQATGNNLKYRWFKNNSFADGPTSVSQQYVIESVAIKNIGSYYCRVNNSRGSVKSQAIKLKIIR